MVVAYPAYTSNALGMLFIARLSSAANARRSVGCNAMLGARVLLGQFVKQRLRCEARSPVLW